MVYEVMHSLERWKEGRTEYWNECLDGMKAGIYYFSAMEENANLEHWKEEEEQQEIAE